MAYLCPTGLCGLKQSLTGMEKIAILSSSAACKRRAWSTYSAWALVLAHPALCDRFAGAG